MAVRREWSNFDRVAPIYRWLEYAVFGAALQRCRLTFLPAMQRCQRVLVVGDGDGRFLVELVRARSNSLHRPDLNHPDLDHPDLDHSDLEAFDRLDAIDSSEAMMRAAKRRLGTRIQSRGLSFQVCPIARADLEGPYDLIVTHFFLDCFSERELQGIVARLTAAAGPRAQWVISEFGVPERGFVRWMAKCLVWVMYRFFRWSAGLNADRLPDYASSLRTAGFRLKEHHVTAFGLLHSELWEYGAR